MNAPLKQSQAASEHHALALEHALRTARIAGEVDLPCFPQTAVHLQHILSDPDTTVAQIVQVISYEPVLAGRVLQLANSAALNVSGKEIADLKSAVARIGFDMLRSASVAFAMQQLSREKSLAPIRTQLEVLWERSAWTASAAYVIARRFTRVNRDQAFLAGLMHGVGKLFVLTRASEFPFVLSDRARYSAITKQWHRTFSKPILQHWKVSGEIIAAVQQYEDLNRDTETEADLTDVLCATYLLTAYMGRRERLPANLEKIKAFARIGLQMQPAQDVLTEAQDDIEVMRRALS
jgi:HD-like signal output (HDOD) protein